MTDDEPPSDSQPAGNDLPPDGALDPPEGTGETGRVGEDAFVEREAGTVDEEALWERVGGREDESEDDAVANAVVPKRSYCERCEHFAEPPSVACTHPGTRIVELVDSDHFRVVGCPVAGRRREIDRIEADLDGERD